MSYLIDKPAFAAKIYEAVSAQIATPGRGLDGMRLIQLMAGIFTETLLLFEDPDEGLQATITELSAMLGQGSTPGALASKSLPPAYVIDYETENGRAMARDLFEEWLNCAYEFHDLLLFVLHHFMIRMETHGGQPRSETLHLFIECTTRCLAYEIAAQELCEIVIDRKIGRAGWSLNESIAGLRAIAGRRVALSMNGCALFSAPRLPDKLDHVAYVMTQEAVRLGIPAGSDWRFGLAANDYRGSAPYELIVDLEPECWALFKVIDLRGVMDQSVACAKAAGRMLALAAAGDMPELDPVIAKPLAMAAMTETYRTVCSRETIIAC